VGNVPGVDEMLNLGSNSYYILETRYDMNLLAVSATGKMLRVGKTSMRNCVVVVGMLIVPA